MQYQYFPGCSLHGTAREYALSFEAVAGRLGLDLKELRDWNCCGATAARSLDESLPLILAARNLALAQGGPGALLVPCNLCYNNIAMAARSLQDGALRKQVNSALQHFGLAYSEGVSVLHPLQAIIRDIGLEQIASRVTRPLRGLRVVSYYGCLLTRPRQTSIPDSNYNPAWMDKLAEALAAVALPFSAKTRCCGGPLLMSHPDAACAASKRLLDEALDLGAQCIMVACPMCHMSLDGKQRTIERRYKAEYRLPVLYFTQLLGLAMGLNPDRLGLRTHLVSTAKLLQGLG